MLTIKKYSAQISLQKKENLVELYSAGHTICTLQFQKRVRPGRKINYSKKLSINNLLV